MKFATRNHIILLLILIKWCDVSHAQNSPVLFSAIANTTAHAEAVAQDAAGNSVVAGVYSGTLSFGNISISSPHYGFTAFLVKYDSCSNAVWTKSISGSFIWSTMDLVSDSEDNIYWSGYFFESAIFDNQLLLATAGTFLVKYNSEGNLLWIKHIPGASFYNNNLAIDSAGSIIMTGIFSDTIMFDGYSFISHGGSDIFLIKLDTGGNVLWAKQAGGLKDDASLATAASGNSIYVTGSFTESATFDSVEVSGNSKRGFFLAKYSSSGDIQWVQTGVSTIDVGGVDVAVDKNKNIFTTGNFNGTATFSNHTIQSNGNYGMFISRYDPQGNLIWIKKGEGGGLSGTRKIAVNKTERILLSGGFFGIVTFDTVSVSQENFLTNLFLFGFDTSGTVDWGYCAHGQSTTASDVIAKDDHFTIVGDFEKSISFGGSTLYARGDVEFFVCRFTDVNDFNQPLKSTNDLVVYPNPARDKIYFNFGNCCCTSIHLTIFNSLGQLVEMSELKSLNDPFSVKNLEPGIYVLQVGVNDEVFTAKLILQ